MRNHGPQYVVNSTGELPKQGEWKKLNANNGINVHLRPGYMVAKSALTDVMTTTDYRKDEKLSLIANRDMQGYA